METRRIGWAWMAAIGVLACVTTVSAGEEELVPWRDAAPVSWRDIAFADDDFPMLVIMAPNSEPKVIRFKPGMQPPHLQSTQRVFLPGKNTPMEFFSKVYGVKLKARGSRHFAKRSLRAVIRFRRHFLKDGGPERGENEKPLVPQGKRGFF